MEKKKEQQQTWKYISDLLELTFHYIWILIDTCQGIYNGFPIGYDAVGEKECVQKVDAEES